MKEYDDRVFVELDMDAPSGGSCSAVLTTQSLAVRLRSPLGVRWVDGACVNGCPWSPDRAPVRCVISGPPFGFGYLPSGWVTAHDPTAGSVAAYESATGNATLEVWHDSSGGAGVSRSGEEAYALGNTVPVETIAGGYAVTLDLVGTGPACGRWRLVARGLPQDTFSTIVQQLFPR